MARKEQLISQSEITEMADTFGPVAYEYNTILDGVVQANGPIDGHFCFVPTTEALMPRIYKELEQTPDLDTYIRACMKQATLAGMYAAYPWVFEKPVRMIDRAPLIEHYKQAFGTMPNPDAFSIEPILGVHEGAFFAYLHRLSAMKVHFESIQDRALLETYLNFFNIARVQRGIGAYVDSRIAAR